MGKELIRVGPGANFVQALTRGVCVIALFMAMTQVHAATNTSTSAIQNAFNAALLCKGDFVDARDKRTFDQLTSAQIKVINDEDGNPIDLEYQFSNPLVIDGATVTKVRYVGESGALFFAFAEGNMNDFAKTHHTIPIKKKMKIDVGWGQGKFYRYAATPTKSNPYPNVFFVGREKNMRQGEFIFGCQTYDY